MKYVVSLNGKKYEVEVDKTDAAIVSVSDAPVAAPVAAAPAPVAAAPAAAPAAVVSGGVKIVSPMPGNILSVSVSQGASVKKGDVLLILEAMKMENEIVASADGRVAQLLVQKGSKVNTDDVLAVIE